MKDRERNQQGEVSLLIVCGDCIWTKNKSIEKLRLMSQSLENPIEKRSQRIHTFRNKMCDRPEKRSQGIGCVELEGKGG